jgi:serine/threonine protein kinase
MVYSSELFDTPSTGQAQGSHVKALLSRTPSGYCEVWRIDRGGRFRVLKCLKKEYRDNPLYERLLLKEFEIGYSLNHRNICEYYAFINDAELGNCIEMEWVDGCDLESFLSSEKRDRTVCDKIVGEICSALQYMHAKQVLHRDLKPSNILITFSGHNVKLIDFGLSDTDSSSILKNPAGTVIYAAPEVLNGGKASIASDLYSLGMVMAQFPNRKYSKIAKKLYSPKLEDRYASVAEVEKALRQQDFKWLWTVLAALAILAVLTAIIIVMGRRSLVETTAPAPEATTINPAVTSEPDDTSTPDSKPNSVNPAAVQATQSDKAQSAAPQQAKKTQPQNPAKSQSTDTTLIDELFRQATELFE